MRRLSAPIAIAALALAPAGCGSSTQDQVKAKVQELARSVGSGDYRRICEDVLAPSLVTRLRSYGISCERAMSIAFSGVRNPAISVGSVRVADGRASAITLSMAAGQPASLQTIVLVKTGQGWRIVSLRAL